MTYPYTPATPAQDTAIDVAADAIGQVSEAARTLVRLVDALTDLLDANPAILTAASTAAPTDLVTGGRASLYAMQILTADALRGRVLAFLAEELDANLLPGVTVRQAINRRA